MLKVGLSQAAEGMVLGMPVYHPRRPGTVLLQAGVTLTDGVLMRLGEMGVHTVWIRYPSLDFLTGYVDPAVMGAARKVSGRIAEAFDTVQADTHAKLDFGAYRNAIASWLGAIAENPRAALLVEELVDAGEPALRHATTVCLLSVLMGLKLDFYLVRERAKLASGAARDVTSLGMAGMLHDVGMLRLEPGVLARWNATRDESDAAWREHVNLGFSMVRGGVEPSAASAVLHHHERFDGTGFPGEVRHREPVRQAGSDIHVFARVVAAADMFDRLRSPASDPGSDPADFPSIPTVRALKRLREFPLATRVDPVVMVALFAVTPPYPPGTMVALSTGERGVVVDWSPLDPCRPVVQPLRRRQGDPGPGEAFGLPVDLRVSRQVEVTECEGHRVREDNFYPRYEGEFDLSRLALGLAPAERKDQTLRVKKRAG